MPQYNNKGQSKEQNINSTDLCPYDLNTNGGMIRYRENYLRKIHARERPYNPQSHNPYDLSQSRLYKKNLKT